MDDGERAMVEDFYTNPLLGGLHGAFLWHAGKALDSMPRPRFGQHDPDHAFTNDDFVARFGIDTSHRMHPIRQHHVLTSLIEYGFSYLSDYDRESLELTAVVHDFGEPFSDEGDVIFGGKKDEDAETAARHEVIRAITPSRAEEIIDRTEPNLADRDSSGGRIFYISELIGYCLTGKRAGQVYLEEVTKGHLAPEQLTVAATIAIDVLYHTVPKLERYRHTTLAAGQTAHDSRALLKQTESRFARENPFASLAAANGSARRS